MRAKDAMTQPVISISSQDSILEAVRLMLQHKISGLPAFDESGNLAGIVTEGDFLRRTETDTLRRRPRWIEFFVGAGKLAEEYVHASARKVGEVMTTEVHAVSEDTPLDEVVTIMEQHRIRRVPVMRGKEVVGIVTRADLLRALINTAQQRRSMSTDDPGQIQCHLDSASLRARAEQCRALADGLNDEKMHAAMFRIAADYEQMAVNAARLEHETEK